MAGEKILIIDDEEDILLISQMSLRKVGGFEVVTALGGEEGLEKAVRERPDLIVMDVMMPGLDGPATLKRLKALPETAETPVVFLTAKTQRNEVERLKNLGAADVLTKPFDPISLPGRIRELLPVR
ncbi:MAG: response regulator [Nitrospinota bacterium]|nr:response regulator [Nitrospinota bacterium]